MPQFDVLAPLLDKVSGQWNDRSSSEKTVIAAAGGAASLALGVLLYRRWA
jgi:hypothetical protein